MITIKRIYKDDFPEGKKITYSYTSEKYYNVLSEKHDNGWTFTLKEELFDTPYVKHLEDDLFDEYREAAEVYIAEINGVEAAIMVILEMSWNKTLVISDLYVQSEYKGHGIGSRLIDLAKNRAQELGARAVVVETQTSNYPAIQFYLKKGFTIVGFNTISYSNDDGSKKEVRLELAYLL